MVVIIILLYLEIKNIIWCNTVKVFYLLVLGYLYEINGNFNKVNY